MPLSLSVTSTVKLFPADATAPEFSLICRPSATPMKESASLASYVTLPVLSPLRSE